MIRGFQLAIGAIETGSRSYGLEKLIEPGKTGKISAAKRGTCGFRHVTGRQAGKAVVSGNSRNIESLIHIGSILHAADQAADGATGESCGANER